MSSLFPCSPVIRQCSWKKAQIKKKVFVTIPRLNLKTVCIDSLLCYISFVSSMALFSFRKKWLSYLPHAISPYLHGKLINWTIEFYSSFCCTVLPRILNILIFTNRQGCFSHLYLSIIFYAFSYIIIYHCLCILIN